MLFRVFLPALAIGALAFAQSAAPASQTGRTQSPDHYDIDEVRKMVDDLMWHMKLGDIAQVDKVRYTSLPSHRAGRSTTPGAQNPLIVAAYTFIPKSLDRTKKHPLIVFAHGGVHSDVGSSSYAHIFRELLEQGYTIIAPDYRGSTGYGRSWYEHIDYGGRENDDVWAGRNWMLETYSFLDPKRVGIMGWSHGGMITLMNLFQHPADYTVAYAGVPVSDLVLRLGYEPDSYRALFSAPYHIGKTVREDIPEYRRRSPVTHVDKLATPLLVHTNTNDEDVNVIEVEALINALKAAGKKFEYKIYQEIPGGHAFNRLDTKVARESRQEIYAFLARYLKN